MNTYKILYTHLTHYKKAVNKKGQPLPGKTKWVIIEADTPNKAILSAKQECNFNDNQLLGCTDVSDLKCSSY